MQLSYKLARAAQGWEVSENGEILLVVEHLPDALHVVELLTFAAKAVGGSATVVVEGANPA
jgi:hypothetical protein